MILVPVKNLENAKQRLSPLLTPTERFAFAEAMLQDLLYALAACSRRDDVALVTSERRACRLAVQLGFDVISDPANQSETAAIAMATQACLERGAEYSLVVPADIPLADTSEFEAVFAAAPSAGGAVLVPSSSGRGSNAVLRRPADLFPLRFGDDSFPPHIAAARATGQPVQVLKLPGIGLDVDDANDLAALLAAEGSTRAQRLLRDWRVERRCLRAAHG